MIYLDHNATTAPSHAVLQAMAQAMAQHWANASSQHAPGQEARRCLAQARQQAAQALGCKPAELVFTSGATESNQLAVRGLLAGAPVGRRRVLFSQVEHSAHLALARSLAAQGVSVGWLPVRPDGALDLRAATELINPEVALVSLMAANNETGVLMPLAEVAALTRQAGALLHTDATQWLGKLPFRFDDCAADAVSFSAHKFHGPKGVGGLLLRQGLAFHSPVPGSQERGRRGGTENLPAIVGLATALSQLGDAGAVNAEARRQATLRDALEQGLAQALPELQVWGQGQARLPGTSYLRVGLLAADTVLQRLARLGVAASSGAACSSGGSQPSHVLSAMGVPREQALAAVRLSLGRDSTADDVNAVLQGLPALLAPLLHEAQACH
ncbi:cysteine desulfurase family protein [Curvibacter gracilis]|uniref:cysteine desulfurase family protein n=1 Tax=Curvibacter gracilis TaxID=230310 RepID=UPI00047F4733|nr:cysteine desulfurase family protein [Curvibacter gracilis]